MTIRWINIVLFLLSTALSIAQKVEWKPQFKMGIAVDAQQLIKCGNDFYMVRTPTIIPGQMGIAWSKFLFEKYQWPEMNQVYSKEIKPVNDKGKSLVFLKLFNIKGNIVVILQRDNGYEVYGQIMNPDGTMSGKAVLLGTKDDCESTKGNWQVALSDDSSEVMTFYAPTSGSSKVNVNAFDKNLTKLWAKEKQLPYDKGNFTVIYQGLSKDNDVRMVVEVQREAKEKSQRKYHTVLLYNPNSDALRTCDIDLGRSKKIADCSLNMDKQGNYVIAGFFSYPDDEHEDFGSFSLRIDKNSGKMLKMDTADFPEDFMLHFMSEKDMKKGKGINDIVVSKLIVLEDNSVIVAAERMEGVAKVYRTMARTMMWRPDFSNPGGAPNLTGGSVGFTEPEEPRFMDIILEKINADGSVAWIKNAAKKQQALYQSLCSYAMFITSTGICTIFNDKLKNLQLDPKVIAEEKDDNLSHLILDMNKNSVINSATFDIATGKIKRIPIVPTENEARLIFLSPLFIQISPTQAIFYRELSVNGQFGIVNF